MDDIVRESVLMVCVKDAGMELSVEDGLYVLPEVVEEISARGKKVLDVSCKCCT